jgi:hypothetical protein
MLRGITVAMLALGVAGTPPPTDAIREQCERELALVRHIHRHVVAPFDGLALAADRQDLQRRGAGASSAETLAAGASDAELLGRLSVVADLWYARVIGRTPFHQMRRESLARIGDAQRAVGELQSRSSAKERDRFLPEIQAELDTLSHLASGRADVNEADIDLALTIADQAAAGRPVLAYGPSQAGGPYGARPAGAYPAAPSAAPSVPPGTLPPAPSMPSSAPPPPPSSGLSPYTLPPGYSNYAPPTAASATSSPSACQVLRLSAGTSASSAGMLRAVECWTSLQAWPGWMAEVAESLDWAATYAKADRDCTALGAVIDRVRAFGRPLAPGIRPEDVAAIAERAETDRRVLKAANRCR